jgi:hypothetical protein
MEETKKQQKTIEWYFHPAVVLLALLVFGPLGLILVWSRPGTPLGIKITLSIAVLAVTYLATFTSVEYYREMATFIEDVTTPASGS